MVRTPAAPPDQARGMLNVWAVSAAFAATLLGLQWMLASGAARLALDRPNARSLHAAPVPRTGGLGILLGVALAFTLIDPGGLWLALTLALGLALLSFLDDRHPVPVAVRLLGHALAAAGLLWFWPADPGGPGGDLGAGPAAALRATLALLAVVWMTNLFNFMDGADGLAGGMAVAGFSVYGAAAALAGEASLAAAAFAVAAAAGAFLVFNFHPARIFMGDAGSVPLGFLAAAFGLYGWRAGLWPAWFPAVVFLPFVLDATVTLARRLLRGERIWQAHCGHYFQRLIRMGWGHRRLALSEYVLMAVTGLVALAMLRAGTPARAGLALALAAVYAGLMTAVDARWRRAGRGA